MRSSKSSLAALAAMVAATAGLGVIVAPDPTGANSQREASATNSTSSKPAQQRASVATEQKVAGLMSSLFRSSRFRYPSGPGWSQAQVQRMARKRRNVIKNRRAQKRAGR